MTPLPIPDHVQRVLQRLRERGYAAHPVGGCVRDGLLGLRPGDWDVCTAALPEEVKALFPELRVLETGLRHGTVTLLTDCGGVEVTTFRSDGAYADCRRPEQVRFIGDLQADLARRDFTVNAMALDEGGTVIDPFGGQADLAAGLLRCVGPPEQRFREDGLRLLRALRFLSRFGFEAEAETDRALEECRDCLRAVSPERVLQELLGILAGAEPGRALSGRQKLLCCAVPALEALSSEEWEAACAALAQLPADGLLRLARLLQPLGSVGAAAALKALHCDKTRQNGVAALLRAVEAPLPRERAELAALLAALGETQFFDFCRLLGSLGRQEEGLELEARARALLASGLPLQLRELKLDGKALLALGFAPGPELGRMLERLLRAVWNGTLENSPAALLAAAKGWKEEGTGSWKLYC